MNEIALMFLVMFVFIGFIFSIMSFMFCLKMYIDKVATDKSTCDSVGTVASSLSTTRLSRF